MKISTSLVVLMAGQTEAASWSEWGEWSVCASSGKRIRDRTCPDTAPFACGVEVDQEDQTCLPPLKPMVEGGEGTPCPSDCWNWNPNTNQCELKADDPNPCFTLTCNSDQMTVDFAGKLFDYDGDDDSTFGDFSGQKPAKTGDRWAITCNLGACGHTTAVNADNLEFGLKISNAMPSLTVGDTSDEIDLMLAPVGSDVTFTCKYPTLVEVSSDDFTVKGATATGSTSKVGDLTDSFDLGVYIDNGFATAADATNLFIGQTAYVKINWEVTTASAVDFLVDECNVVQDDYTDSSNVPQTGKSVAIIKKNCQSKALGVKAITADKRNSNEYTFEFTSFTVGGTTTIELAAKMTCKVKMCLKTDLTCGPVSALDSDCEVVPGYEYVANNQ